MKKLGSWNVGRGGGGARRGGGAFSCLRSDVDMEWCSEVRVALGELFLTVFGDFSCPEVEE